MTLKQIFLEQGATLADDGIPIHFGDLNAEYQAALNAVVVLNRPHEGRIELIGKDRFELLNRMSTNNLLTIQSPQGKPTIFTNPNARVIERVIVYPWSPDGLLLMTGPGRGQMMRNYLQRNIFFKDEVKLNDLMSTTHQFTLHGPRADDLIKDFAPEAITLPEFGGMNIEIQTHQVFVARREAFSGSQWAIICQKEDAEDVWQAIMQTGKAHNIRPAGGLLYNLLRIRAGFPGVGRELTEEYIPLELGLWDEISFNKGCYTGQEIIARMESRNRLARTIVRLALPQFVEVPTDLFYEGRTVGKVTSCVAAPDGEIFAIGVVKLAVAVPETILHLAAPDGEPAKVKALLGIQPPYGD